ncbi:hypothetical protein AYI68_g3607 [Smittium mucronatum]|uniref:Uncharacterized protein n=1 Tax=Smittium mucronatum TaxID=133383 RepID=A0A1R0GZH5_9FUNG|nr:hypothetical protein AYI68_g3607 [Smittium mucronatum]
MSFVNGENGLSGCPLSTLDTNDYFDFEIKFDEKIGERKARYFIRQETENHRNLEIFMGSQIKFTQHSRLDLLRDIFGEFAETSEDITVLGNHTF